MEALAFEQQPLWWRRPGSRVGCRIRVILVLGLLGQTGCQTGGDYTGQMTPRSWRGNPWGPEAQAARRCGQLPTIPYNPPMVVWAEWARTHLRNGDIVFRMGDARLAFGLYPFSRVSAEMAGSRFSHSGIVAWENGEFVVYDTNKSGPRRQPFPIWVLDATGPIAVKRPKAHCQRFVESAVAFCRDVYQRQVPFDRRLAIGDERFYCIELTERAYESAGLVLSQPVCIKQLPRYHDFPKAVWFGRHFSPVRPEQEAFVIGNESVGIWSSPDLELVYETPNDHRGRFDAP